MNVEEFAADMGPTCHFGDAGGSGVFIPIEFGKAAIAVGMQMTGKGDEMVAAMLAFAVRGIAVEHGGRRDARMGPLVAQVDPEAAGLGLAGCRGRAPARACRQHG